MYEAFPAVANRRGPPHKWTAENLRYKHPSRSVNPEVANILLRAGHIESWGRGTLKMINECRAHGLPAPRYAFEAGGALA
ncbi:ATP-binding protein [Hymenobacter sp. IS2118]|uniref:ATP-binding protein n=1 Tax=Hymenobacter sp. IS2118 TaxID=1505605 RepID=UPI0009DF8635